MEIKTFYYLFSYILVLTISTSPTHSAYYTKSTTYTPVQLKKTHLRFFFHDNLGGPDPTAVQIAGQRDANNPIPFGALFAIDDPLTEGPELTSRAVGNARGMYLSSSRGDDVALVLYVDLGFTAGKFNGSSLSVFSRNPVAERRREMAVVGGRGLFRRAEGTVFVTTHFVNFTYALLEYNVEVVHP
ncbi:dirigent protein 4-like [Salvia hispanica]|uniref:dirigent protein 4-like n=1 Tax=Salvia hispanica TaxID=49212 RepID=UPI002009C69A|nr:dirigent protein 4-like [Salvia hispanica]